MLKGKIQSHMFTLANFYLSNSNPFTVLEIFLSSLVDFLEGTILLQSHNGPSQRLLSMGYPPYLGTVSVRTQLKKPFSLTNRHTVWRFFHPQKKDFFLQLYSSTHGSYSRINFFWVKHSPSPWSPELALVRLPHLTRPRYLYKLYLQKCLL